MAAEKAAQREQFHAVRRSLRESDRRRASERIVGHVLDLPEIDAAQTVHVFWPLVERGEVDTRPLIQALQERGVDVVLPAVLDRSPPRLAHRRFGGVDALVPSPWGLLEPAPDAPAVDVQDLDVVIVPGLAMGRDGSRLGYGGGYYDAFLASTPAFRVGVVWAAALVETLPTDRHDVQLNVVVTEDGPLRIPSTGRPDRNTSGAAT